MTIEDAANAVYRWLCTLAVQISPMVMCNDLGEQHFSVAVEQVFPVHKMLKYRVTPTEVADCYEVKEVDS